ncbi:MAG: TonB-dependent receptor [Opitutales bacterium]|nr:TonB-dependent receptor [Opitutales bacterium]
MKTISLSSTLLLFTSVSLLAGGPIFELNPVRVTGTAISADETHSGRVLALSKPVDLAEVLSRESSSFTHVRKGPVAGDFLLRGLGKDNIEVTLDGSQIQGACPNRMDPPAFHVSSQQIRRVTVRTGPFDVESGSSIGGSVRVETGLNPAAPAFQTTFFAGQFDSFGGGAQGQFRGDDFSLGGGAFYQEGGVYKDGAGNHFTDAPQGNNAYRPGVSSGKAFAIWNATALAEVPLPNGVLDLSVGYNDARDVLYPGLRMDGIKDVSWRGRLAYRHTQAVPWADEWVLRVSGSRVEHDMTDTFRMSSQMNPVFAQRGFMMRTEAETQVGEVALTADRKVANWDLRYGTDYREIRWHADNIIMMQTNDFLPDTLLRRGGLWASGFQSFGDWDLEVAGRLDVGTSRARRDISFLQEVQDTSTNRQTDILPAGYLLVGHALDTNHRLEVGLGHGNRQPTGQERYMQLNHPNSMMANRLGNPDVNPVRSTEIRLSLEGEKEAVSYRAAVFHSWLTDYIYPVGRPNPDLAQGNTNTFDNIDARLYGLELSGAIDWSAYLRSEAGISWQEGRKSSLARGMTDRVLGEIPPLQGRLASSLRHETLGLMVEGLWADSQSRIDEEIGEQRISGWVTMNVQAQWQLSETLLLSGGIDNVLDREYATNNAFVRDPFTAGVVVNEPGRFAYLRATVEF